MGCGSSAGTKGTASSQPKKEEAQTQPAQTATANGEAVAASAAPAKPAETPTKPAETPAAAAQQAATPAEAAPEAPKASKEDEEAEAEERKKMAAAKGRKKENIMGVGASEEDIKNYKPPSFEKSEESKAKIAETLKKNEKMSVLGIGKLPEASFNEIVMAFEQKVVKESEDVIRQGEQGDAMYIVESGNFDIFVSRTSDDGTLGAPVKVANFGPGSLFGELAILYDAPRAATVRCASSDSQIWSLGRECFQMMLKKCGVEKVEQYSGWLTQVDILKVLNHHEISQLADSCETTLFDKDEVIMKQGDAGDAFYILEEGSFAAFLEGDGGEIKVKTYEKQGEFFGELALTLNVPRRATVRALSDCSVLVVQKESFEAMLGPILPRLREQASQYPQYAEMLAQIPQ
jgi:cAMP-dependent protein kinase regulator